jgi:hypothetical protein
MTFLLSEDEALRNLLLGMTVVDQKSTTDSTSRSVKVYFGQPDQEIREQSYPYITIDMIDISEDPARAHRGLTKPSYLPDPSTDPSGGGVYDEETQSWYIHWPIPVNIDYQVTTYARQPRHDRQLLGQMLSNKIPMRFAVFELAEMRAELGDPVGINLGECARKQLRGLHDLARDDPCGLLRLVLARLRRILLVASRVEV